LDIFGSAFFMLTRYEEMVIPERDNLDRFPAAAALAVQERFLDRPIVNDYIDILWWALKRCWPALRRKPRDHRVFLSHDIDEVSTLGRSAPSIALSIGADLIKRREPLLAARKARAWIETKVRGTMIDRDPYNTFDFIMRTSEALGLNSAFNVTPGHSHHFDPPYRIEQEWILRLLRQIASRGHEVGYQASYNTHRDSERTCMESELLRRILSSNGIDSDLRGGRQHFLRWANPVTWQNWEDAGLEYDTTLTHAEQAGFRCGCCYEYPVWNLERRQRLRLRERPLVAMESSLLSYQKLRLDRAEQALLDLSATCRRYDGDFTLLWHNAMLVGKEARAVYARVASTAVNGTHRPGESDACETQVSTAL
jgi:hypothetical protein